MLKSLLKPVASLRLTVVLMAIAIALIFCATWAQIDKGIWTIVREYFRSFVVWVPVQIFLPRPEPGEPVTRFGFPLPGGYLLGSALLINLLAAHAVRFRLTWKRSGIHLIHASVILLLVGEAVTGAFAIEAQMPIYEGQASCWAHDIREAELAVLDPCRETGNEVAIDDSQLRSEHVIRHESLPFEIEIDRYMTNSRILRRTADDREPPQATVGLGLRFRAEKIRPVTGISEQNVNYPAALVSLRRDGRFLGRYLLSPFFKPDKDVGVVPQDVRVGDKTYQISLRFRRYYKPYAIHLVDFRHDLYTGTTVARNFSSEIRLTDPARSEDRRVLIYMNHPLRYRGETFYQSAFLPGDVGTILSVVGNPGWPVPYVACTLGALGLLIHFGMLLLRFLKRTRS